MRPISKTWAKFKGVSTLSTHSLTTLLLTVSIVLVVSSATAFTVTIPAYTQGQATTTGVLPSTGLRSGSEGSSIDLPENQQAGPEDESSEVATGAQTTLTPLAAIDSSLIAKLEQLQTAIASTPGTSSQGSSGNQDQESSGGVFSPPPPVIVEEQPAPTAPTAAQEQIYHNQLINQYNFYINRYNELLACYNQLITELNEGYERPGGSIVMPIDQTSMTYQQWALQDVVASIPTNSEWYKDGQTLLKMHTTMANARAFLSRIKGFNPNTVRSELSSRLTYDGRVIYFAEFDNYAATLHL